MLRNLFRVLSTDSKPPATVKRERLEAIAVLHRFGVGITSLAGLGTITHFIVNWPEIDWADLAIRNLEEFYCLDVESRIAIVAIAYLVLGFSMVACARCLERVVERTGNAT